MFGSSLFYPLEGLPLCLRVSSSVNPLTWHADVLRYLTIGLGSADTILAESAAFMLFTFLAFVAAVRTLQRGIVK
jgi:ABC-type multidrug transport system permease subunit